MGINTRMTPFQVLRPGGIRPVRAYSGDAGSDLVVSEEVVVHPGEQKIIPHAIAVAIPEGCYGRIVGRSSTIRKLGLFVFEGVIDSGYRGEQFTRVWNIGTGLVAMDGHPVIDTIVIPVGARISQLIIEKIVLPQWYVVNELEPSDRGENGFGSSGHIVM